MPNNNAILLIVNVNGIVSTMQGFHHSIILVLQLSQVVCLKCLSCMNALAPTDCAYIEDCGPHSGCYMDFYVTPVGEMRYNLGCRNSKYCIVARRRRHRSILPMLWNQELKPILMDEVTPQRTLNISSGNNMLTKRLINDEITVMCSECCHDSNLCNNKGCTYPGYNINNGPICYNCDQQVSKTSCRQIKECGRDEMCYIEELTITDVTLYHTKCLGAVTCRDQGLIQQIIQPTIIGRDINYDINKTTPVTGDRKRYTKATGGCCDNDLCNTFLPAKGNWGPWMSWSGCTASCGYNGVQRRTRYCVHSTPNLGGRGCEGNSVEIDTTCANKPCNHGLTCLSCSSSIYPRTCNYIETCGPNSVCYLERYVTRNGNTRYRSGCRDINHCNDIRHGKRFLDNGDILSCTECCSGNLCNSHGCSTLPHYTDSGPVCYNCDQQTDPITCDKISICNKGQVCSVKKLPFIGDVIYQTTCSNPEQCLSHSTTDNIYPKCCTTSLCGFPSQTKYVSTSQPSAITSITIVTQPTTTTNNGLCISPVITINKTGGMAENDLLTLKCNATGTPTPTVTWMVLNDRLDGVSVSGLNLYIGPLDQHLLGAYKCKAENSCATVEQNFTLSHIETG